MMNPHNRPRRFQLSTLVYKAKRDLSLFLGFAVILLFIGQLFIMNQSAIRGYVLSKEIQKHKTLLETQEQLELQMAQLQTQEYLSKAEKGTPLVIRDYQTFVIMPLRFTAQKNEKKPLSDL